MRLLKAVLLPALAVLALAGAAPGDRQKFEKTYSFTGDKDIKVGIKVGDVTIESFRVRHWPDAGDVVKGEKDLNDTHTVWLDFTYSNRDADHDYKCVYRATIPGSGSDGPWAENDRTATLDKGKIDDTNKLSLKMKTHRYKAAKTLKVSFEIWRK